MGTRLAIIKPTLLYILLLTPILLFEPLKPMLLLVILKSMLYHI